MEYIEFAKSIALEAGKIAKENFSLGMKKEWKSLGNPVTETDLKINRLVIEKVQESFSEHNIMGEEESDLARESEYLWVCDPIDGTIAFSHGYPTFIFALALVKNGEPIVGVMYDPIMDRLFYAEKGKGAFLNGAPVKAADADTFKGRLIDIENWPKAPHYIPQAERLLQEAEATVIKVTSFQYTSALISCGEFIGSVFTGDTFHDVAALKIIIEEAGGKVTDLDGNEQRYDQSIKGAVISNGKVHDQIIKVINSSGLESTL